MHKKLHIKRITAFLIFLLILTFFTALPGLKAYAEVSISELSPYEGYVGDLIELAGQINTTNGAYEILFDGTPVEPPGNATLTTVEDTFVVPNSTKGDHTVALKDIEKNITSDTVTFAVKTGYYIKGTKPRIQEGENATILVIITGGEANISLSANVTVIDPDNQTHSCPSFNITTEQKGYGETSRIYPTNFDAEPHTFYIGTYNLTLNTTLSNTIGSFAVGLTDAAEYHRFQVVNTKAVNYTLPTDILKITITHNGEIVFTSPTVNASETGGVITANWTIPANASMGLYIVNVINTTSTGTKKPVSDNQTFTIVSKSFACEVNVFNLDGESIEGIVVEANNTFTSAINATTTNNDGLASFYLEATNYVFTAFLNNSKVGDTSETSLAENLTETLALNIKCSLAHIKVAIRDAKGNMLPFVGISANFTYTTRANVTLTSMASTETNLKGITTLRNLFINTNYTIKASRYGQTFNTTILDLTSTSWFNTTCPTLELIIKIFDRSNAPFQGALVKVYDWGIGLSGLAGEETTSASGEVAFNFTFGKYVVKVYKDGILLNETSTLLTDQLTNFVVYCKLYNLTLEVSVLDYFGQGISNANVTIEREETVLSSLTTGGNGVAQFTELVGGNYKIFVYITEKPYRTIALYLQEPKTVTLKLEEIVSIGGFITETSYLLTAAFILLLIIVLVFAFTYRRLKSKRKEE